MEVKTGNKEQIILEAAEKLFVEKGFAGTKTTEIADEAGVNHALLHYYFRTKENLFNRIFEQKLSQVLSNFLLITDDNTPFFDKLKNGIEAHFDFIGKNPKLPIFVLQEVVMDKSRRDFMEKNLFPTGKVLYENFKIAIRKEMKKGVIRPVKAMDILLNIVSLNVFAFVAAQILFDMDAEESREKLHIFLEERKKNNVNLIINSLKY
jgi:AcrR family transcriptional regulator